MKSRGWFALALLFLLLGAGYLAWWKWAAVPPAQAAALRGVSGPLLSVEDVSRSTGPVHPVLHVRIKSGNGDVFGGDIRNRDVTLAQFRALEGRDVTARYSDDTGVVYEFFSGEKQLIDYAASYRQERETYNTWRYAAMIAFLQSAVFCLLGVLCLIGLFGYFRARRKRAA